MSEDLCKLMVCWTCMAHYIIFLFFFQAEDGIRDWSVTGVQTCALPIFRRPDGWLPHRACTVQAPKGRHPAEASRGFLISQFAAPAFRAGTTRMRFHGRDSWDKYRSPRPLQPPLRAKPDRQA